MPFLGFGLCLSIDKKPQVRKHGQYGNREKRGFKSSSILDIGQGWQNAYVRSNWSQDPKKIEI